MNLLRRGSNKVIGACYQKQGKLQPLCSTRANRSTFGLCPRCQLVTGITNNFLLINKVQTIDDKAKRELLRTTDEHGAQDTRYECDNSSRLISRV